MPDAAAAATAGAKPLAAAWAAVAFAAAEADRAVCRSARSQRSARRPIQRCRRCAPATACEVRARYVRGTCESRGTPHTEACAGRARAWAQTDARTRDTLTHTVTEHTLRVRATRLAGARAARRGRARTRTHSLRGDSGDPASLPDSPQA
eukprot:4790411-Prymnesium_polylepis.1